MVLDFKSLSGIGLLLNLKQEDHFYMYAHQRTAELLHGSVARGVL